MFVCIKAGLIVYMCVWRDWHVFGETGVFWEESCMCVCMCGKRDVAVAGKKKLYGGVCIEKGLMCLGGFVSPCSCGKTGLCVYVCLFIICVYVETDRLMSICLCAQILGFNMEVKMWVRVSVWKD